MTKSECPICNTLRDPLCETQAHAFLFGLATGLVCVEEMHEAKDNPAKKLGFEDLGIKGHTGDIIGRLMKDFLGSYFTPSKVTEVAEAYIASCLCPDHKKLLKDIEDALHKISLH